MSGGARGVHDEQVVIAAAFDRRLVCGRRPQAFGQRVGAYPVGDRARRVGLRPDGVDHRRRRRTVDHHLAAAVGQDETHLGCGEAGVDRDRYRAELGRAIEQATELDAVGHQQCHAVALGDPQRGEHVGAPVRQRVHLRVGHPDVGGRLDVGLQPRRDGRALSEHPANVLHGVLDFDVVGLVVPASVWSSVNARCISSASREVRARLPVPRRWRCTARC